MDLVTQQMPARAAREAFLEYKHSIEARQRKERDQLEQRILDEDKELMAAYRVMSRGRRVINFTEACANMGWKPGPTWGLPKVAICRASAKRCALAFPYYYRSQDPVFVDDARTGRHWNHSTLSRPKSAIQMPRDLWDLAALKANSNKIFRCKVPTIPLRHRPAEGQLHRYHLIFEAEWDLTPPLDPFLVKRVSKHFFAVIAQWDLTPLERSLVGMR